MIPYTTCMRFNRERTVRRGDDDENHGKKSTKTSNNPANLFEREWNLLVPCSSSDQETIEPTIKVHSQDDQTLCFTWILDTSRPYEVTKQKSTSYIPSEQQRLRIELVPEIHMPKVGSDIVGSDTDTGNEQQKKGYLLLTLRRRKSIQRSIHIDPIAILDYSYYGITNNYLKNASKWRFSTFTLDILTGGHSLSNLLFYLFSEYKFFQIFNLDPINVWRCFRFMEAGYHDTNPYHNSVHAADVTQAMHCFIQENKIRQHLTPLEMMCALLAAVSHDLDHPGVNQHFLIATKSHLAALYKNFSVLESHHWRFAISCILESHVFDNLTSHQWNEFVSLLKSLILATDITQQGDYIAKFKVYLSSTSFYLENTEHRHFILQIALKCADLGNPCRPWNLSKRWSEQICSEFYRQGDYERELNIPITPICNRFKSSMAAIQTDFFRNIITPLFELWDQYLCSPLSRQLIKNLRFNYEQWKNFLQNVKIKRRNSMSSLITAIYTKPFIIKSNSLNNLSNISMELSLEKFTSLYRRTEKKKCINGCGTPPNNKEDNCDPSKTESKVIWNLEMEDEFDESDDSPSAKLQQAFPISTHASLFLEKKQLTGRRGSAPGCIGLYTSSEIAAAAALVFLHGIVADEDPKRRSSFPADKVGAAKKLANMNNGAKLNWSTATSLRGRSLEMLVSSLKKNKGAYASSAAVHNKLLRRQACSLDSGADVPNLQWFYNSKPRRGSVPQEILVESLSKYPKHSGL